MGHTNDLMGGVDVRLIICVGLWGILERALANSNQNLSLGSFGFNLVMSEDNIPVHNMQESCHGK